MGLTFLCPVHRDWVYFHPQDALTQLEGTQQQGEALMQKREWQKAMRFLGSAFETTEIILELDSHENFFLLSRLTTLSMLLATNFAKLNEMNYGQLILTQTQTKLQAVAKTTLDNQLKQDHVKQCLVLVKNSLEQLIFSHPWAQNITAAQMH
jgi:hypothetical protein